MAYTDEEVIVPCVRNRLISLYIGGLKEQSIRQQVCVTRHATLLAAQTAAGDVERSFKVAVSEARGIQIQHSSAPRQEELMDISAVTSSFQQTLDKAVKTLTQQMGTVQGELKSLRKITTSTGGSSMGNEHQQQAPMPQQQRQPQQGGHQPPWWYNQPPAWFSQQQQQQHQQQHQQQPQQQAQFNPQRPRRRCYECGSFDHMIRDCQQKHASLQAAVQAVLDQRFGTQQNQSGN